MATSDIGIKIGLTGAEAVQSQLAKVEQAMGGVDAQTVRVADAFQQLGNSTAGIGTVGQAMAQYTQQTRDARVEANLLRQANRQLAMQMTDVVTSLASGMPAWMVFIQQGGQIKDSYGGIGQAIQGVTGYLRTLINPLTAAGAAFAAVGAAAFMGAREMDAYVKALTLSGNAAGTTAGALDQMAARIDKVAGTQGKAASVLAELAATGDITASALERVAQAAIELERAGGPAVQETAKQFAALAKDPLSASIKLNESTRFLTLSVYEQVKALEAQGRSADAAAAATDAYAKVVEQRTRVLEGQLGFIEKGWRAVKDGAKEAWDAMLGLGRQDSLEQQLESVRSQLARRMSAQGSARSDNRGAYQPGIDLLRDQEAFLQEQLRLQSRGIALEAERAAVVQARAEWDKKGSQYLSDQQKMQKEITEAQRLGLEGKIAQAEVERRIAAIRASYAGKGEGLSAEAKATGEAVKVREKYLETLNASAEKLVKENQTLAEQVAQVVLGKQAYQDIISAREEEQAVLIETQAIRALDRNLDAKEYDSLKAQAAAIRERISLRKALATATVEAADREIMLRRSALKDQDAQEIIDTQRLKTSQDIIDAINREADALKMSNVEREVTIALLAAEARGIKAGSYEYEEYAKNIRAAIVNRETVRSSIEQTRRIEDEWRRTTDQIGQSLTDALMQGGKSAWEYIKGLFRSMVLRPIIQAVVNPIVGSFGGGGGGALSTLGSINSLASLGSAITGSVTGSIANVIGTAGTMFGSSALTAFSAGMKGATLAPGLMGPTTVGASGAMGAGASVAAAVPYVAAALAVANALGVFRSRSIVGGGLTGTLGAGDIQSYDLQRRGGTLFSGPEYSMINQRVSAESQAIQTAYQALRTNAAAMAEALGLSGDAVRNFTTRLGNEVLQNDLSARGIKLDGLTAEQAAAKVQEALTQANEDLAAFVLGASRTVTETLSTSVESWSETEQGRVFNGFVDQVSQVTRTIEATGISYARAGETNVQTLQRLASSLGTINPALELLGLNLYATSLAGADLASQLADAFGGLENFTQSTAAYYAEFFTEAERAAKTTEQLTKSLGGLGLALPTTRDAYRQLVEAQDLTTEAGRKNFAVLVQLSGTFASITPVLEDVADAGSQVTEALRSAADILRERQGLERQLLQLQGDTAALRALDRAALDESNRALFDRINALQDSQTAEAAAAEATRAAAAETQRIAQEALGLERQRLELMGDTAALRALDRAALDASNRALFDHIAALRDMRAANEAAAQSLRDVAAARQRDADAAGGRTNAALAAVRSAIDAQTAAAEASLTAAYDVLVAGIERQKLAATATRQVAQETLQAARGIFDYLSDQIADLRGTVGAGMSSAQGRSFVQAAAAAARASGLLPDQDSLAKAVAAARGGLDTRFFASAADQRRATLLLAQDLAELQAVAGDQVSVAEQTLAVAEQQLESLETTAKQAAARHEENLAAVRANATLQLAAAQAQVDELRGVNTSVLSVAAALQALAGAIASERAATAAAAAAQAAVQTASTAAAAAAGTQTAAAAATPARMRTMADLPADWSGRSAASKIDWFNDKAITVAELTQAGTAWADIQWMLKNGYKGFANGGLHMGGLRLVGERGPELEVTGPSRIWSYEQTRQMFGNPSRREELLVAELRALRTEVEGLHAETRATAVSTNKTARILERVTPDGASLQTVPAP
ncbi:MAG: phage tail length tape measure family protein [Roseomonas sp.]|nr:phage tail length tape measure family protein [Roseomonas sp.]